MPSIWRRASLVPLVLTTTVCSGPRSDPDSTSVHEILVSAAASLSDAFAEMETRFETDHPGADVVLNLAGSSSLRQQILEGAPAAVYAAANRANMDRLVEAGEVSGEPRVFTRNRLTIAVPPGNPADITGLRDFADPERLIGLCAEEVPCGALAREALGAAGIVPAPDTNEPDVRALLTKVELAELDAAITYVTDVESAGGRVEGVAIPDSENVFAEYPIAVLTNAPHPELAEMFVQFVLSEEGRVILRRHGFRSP